MYMTYLRWFLCYWCYLSLLRECQISSTEEYLKVIRLHRAVNIKAARGGVINWLSCFPAELISLKLTEPNMDFFPIAQGVLNVLGRSCTCSSPVSSPSCFPPDGFGFWAAGAGQRWAGLRKGASGCDVVMALGSSWRKLLGQLILRHLLATVSGGTRAALTSYTWVDESLPAFIQVVPIIAEMWWEKFWCKHTNSDRRCLAWWMSSDRVCPALVTAGGLEQLWVRLRILPITIIYCVDQKCK